MFKLRILLLAAGCWLGATAAGAQTVPYVNVNGQLVHPTRLLVKYSGGATTQAQAATPGRTAALRQAGMVATRHFQVLPGWASLDVEVSPASNDPAQLAQKLNERIIALRNSGEFEYVEPDYIRKASIVPTDARFTDGTLWGLRNLGQNGGVSGVDIGVASSNPQVQQGWDLTTGITNNTTNVIVAVIDTGVLYTHLDLAANMWRNPGETAPNTQLQRDDDNNGIVDDINGINSIFNLGDPIDDNGHGTHVAGTIGAVANNGNPHVGVIWRVRLMALKFLDSNGFGSVSDSITCIDYAISKGAKIINASYGSTTFSQAEFDAVVRARNAGVLFIAAAGNDGTDNDLLAQYPANYTADNVISVAAIDRRGSLANFSCFGLTKVHLGAPGVSILSTHYLANNDYATFDGTSMAAPHVAGVAALIYSRFPTASRSEVRTRLLRGTKPLASLNGKTQTGGMVNAQSALTLVGDGQLEIDVDPAAGARLLQGSTVTFSVTVTDVLPVNNATVTGTMPGVFTDLTFVNNGVAPDLTANDEIYTATATIPANLLGNTSLTLSVTAPQKAQSTTSRGYVIVASPINDNFANATKIATAGGIVNGTNSFASLEASEPLHGGVSTVASSVWWNWAPTSGGDTLIDFSGTTFDFVMAVYTGTSFGNLVEVATLNSSLTGASKFTRFNAVAGTTYRIAVAGVTAAAVGDIRMRLEIGGQPDTSAPILTVTQPSSGLITTNSQVVVSGTAQDPVQSGSGVAAVFVRINGGLPTQITGTNSWTTTVFLQPGANTVQVFARDFAGNTSPATTLTVTYRIFDPPNDFFFNAIALTSGSGTISNNTFQATREGGEPNHAGVSGHNSIWYSFVAPANGVLYLNTTNSTFDTLLAVYTGNRVDQLTPLLSNDDDASTPGATYSKVNQTLQASQKYYIAIDGGDGAAGAAILNYAFSNTTIHSVTVSNVVGGTVSPGSGQYSFGTSLQLTATPAPGFDFVTWEGTYVSQANPLNIVVTNNAKIGPVFLPKTLADDFETGNLTRLNWAAHGNTPWAVQSTNASETNTLSGRKFFARTGSIGNNQSSILTLTTTNVAGMGSFSYRVSSEQSADFFSFYINNTNLASTANRLLNISGETGWTNTTFNVPAGTNTFQWRYVKDGSFQNGIDAVFLDSLDLPLVVPKNSSTPAVFNFITRADNNIEFRVFGQTNQVYVIQISADLANWEPISTNMAVHGIIQLTLPQDVNLPNRFYRAVVP